MAKKKEEEVKPVDEDTTRIRIESDGTWRGTHVFGPTGDEITNVSKVEWSLDVATEISTCRVTLTDQAITAEVEEANAEIIAEQERTQKWKRYQVQHVNEADSTIYVTDMEAGVRRTLWVAEVMASDDETWKSLAVGDAIKANVYVDDDGDSILYEFIKD